MLSRNAELVILLLSSLFHDTLIWMLLLFFLQYLDSVDRSSPWNCVAVFLQLEMAFLKNRCMARTSPWLSNPWLPELSHRTFDCQLSLLLNPLLFREGKKKIRKTSPSWTEDTRISTDHVYTSHGREVCVGCIRKFAQYQFRIFTSEF